jgi:hypothetical protein
MKKLLVIVDPGEIRPENILNNAIGNQPLPKGVLRLAATAWLIDAATSLPFFAALVSSAEKLQVPLYVSNLGEEPLRVPPLKEV